MHAGNPPTPSNGGYDRTPITDRRRRRDPAMKFRPEDRSPDKAITNTKFATCREDCHSCRAAGARRRAVQLARFNGNRIHPDRDPLLICQRLRELTERNMRPLGIVGMDKPKLLARRRPNSHPQPRKILRFPRYQFEAARAGIDDDEAIAAICGIDAQRTDAFYLEHRPELVGERRDILDLDLLSLALAALCPYADQSRRRLDVKYRLRFLHHNDTRVEQNGCDTDRI